MVVLATALKPTFGEETDDATIATIALVTSDDPLANCAPECFP